MIRLIVDALLLLALSIVAWWREPFFGVVVLGVSLSFVAQYWRTLHLLGSTIDTVSRGRKLMAAIVSVLFGGIVFLILGQETPAPTGVDSQWLWQESFLPIWIGLSILASLGLIYLNNERKKR